MEIKLQTFLNIVEVSKEKSRNAGRGLKKKNPKKVMSLRTDLRTESILNEFCKNFNLEKTQVIEGLIELLPYLQHEINYKK